MGTTPGPLKGGKIRHPLTLQQWRKAEWLLDMLYTPAELAEELGDGLTARQIYQTLIPNAGMPHSKDENGRIWLHGTEVSKWSKAIVDAAHAQLAKKKSERKSRVRQGQAWCLGCAAWCVPQNAQTHERTRKNGSRVTTILEGNCPTCGRKIVKFSNCRFVKPEDRDWEGMGK